MLSGYLRQSTAGQSVVVGPFISSTDGVTPLTSLTIANTDVKLMKSGGSAANKNSGGGTHRINASYALTFDATDTSAVGELAGSIAMAGALIVPFKYYVLEEVVFDKLFAVGATGEGSQLDDIQAAILAIPTAAQTADEMETRSMTVGALTPAAADVMLDQPILEPVGVFLWSNATLRTITAWMGKMHRDKVTQSTTEQNVYDAEGTTVIATSATTDDGTTTTRGGF